MIWLIGGISLAVGVLAGVLVTIRIFRTAIDSTMGRADAAEQMNAQLNEELNQVSFSLGGRLRNEDQPPIYLMPPGQENAKSCDDARLAWMEKCDEAAKIMRAADMHETADKFFPLTVTADQFSAKRADPNAAPSAAESTKYTRPGGAA